MLMIFACRHYADAALLSDDAYAAMLCYFFAYRRPCATGAALLRFIALRASRRCRHHALLILPPRNMLLPRHMLLF